MERMIAVVKLNLVYNITQSKNMRLQN